MKKDVRFLVCFTRPDMDKLAAISKLSGLSISEVIRRFIEYGKVIEMPPVDYHKMTAELHAIGNNLNQIAHAANATGNIEAGSYRENADKLFKLLYEIKSAFYNWKSKI